jgi:NTE family protein
MVPCSCSPSGELGIALSGGGAKALAQVGVLKVLEREGVPLSYVAGTSAGALIGAIHVTSRDTMETEERILAHLRSKGVGFNSQTFRALAAEDARRPGGILAAAKTIWRAARAGGVVVEEEPMRNALLAVLGDATFADARLPFATTALDLVTGRKLIFAGGSLVDAVYASAAIPGLFEPLKLDGAILVDGGWAEPVPVDTCQHLGAIHVVAVDVPGSAPVRSGLAFDCHRVAGGRTGPELPGGTAGERSRLRGSGPGATATFCRLLGPHRSDPGW